MPLNHPRPNHNHASEYQQSGIPWVKTISGNAETAIEFPYVTRFIVISATHATKIAFDDAGVDQTQYFNVPAGGMTARLEVKVTKLWIKASDGGAATSVLAGLTNVKASDFPDITELPGIKGQA